MQSDIEIAQAARLKPIHAISDGLGIPEEALDPRGRHIGKVAQPWLDTLAERPDGKLVLVTAISPTPAGEGKTTTTVGLGDALNRIGQRTVIALREPSLGPVFGMKGGAAGGGHAQVVPMEDINLHFTGDFAAIAAAHNLLAALLDNHLHHGNALGIDPRRITWRRVLDMNDRALRDVVLGLGGQMLGQVHVLRREALVDEQVGGHPRAVISSSMPSSGSPSRSDLQNWPSSRKALRSPDRKLPAYRQRNFFSAGPRTRTCVSRKAPGQPRRSPA